MPSVGSSYTFADFLRRLERSPVDHMSPLYHAHRELFVHRPDMMVEAIRSLSWERGAELLRAAYYAQPVDAEAYRAVLARMLRHNRFVLRERAGSLVPWQAALNVYSEALHAHGATLPSRVTVSTLRLLAPSRQWRTSLGLLTLAENHEQLTKTMLVDAAHGCATPEAWSHALALLHHLHAEDPARLTGAILSLRPHTQAEQDQLEQYSMLPRGDAHADPTPSLAQRHMLRVMSEVIGATPWEVALSDGLGHSFLTHLVASTAFPAEEKLQLLSTALAGFPYTEVLKILTDYAEINLLPQPATSLVSGEGAKEEDEDVDGGQSPAAMLADAKEDASSTALLPSPGDSLEASMTIVGALSVQLGWTSCSPNTIATLLALLVRRGPSPRAAHNLILAASRIGAVSESSPLPAAARHPLVLSTLLQRCADDEESEDGWSIAVREVLLDDAVIGFPSVATATDVLSALVLAMRRAKQVHLMVRVLQEHIIPTGSKLSPPAVEAMMEAILAYNRARGIASSMGDEKVAEAAGRPVHWMTALSFLTTGQPCHTEASIRQTGTGPSAGAPSRTPTQHVALHTNLSGAMLSLAIAICVEAGSPRGGLRTLAYARDSTKLELALGEEIKAFLYSIMYGREYEAKAIVKHATAKHGQEATRTLQTLLELHGERQARLDGQQAIG